MMSLCALLVKEGAENAGVEKSRVDSRGGKDCATLCPLYSGCGRTLGVCGRWMPSRPYMQ